jgi:hypothetical protein
MTIICRDCGRYSLEDPIPHVTAQARREGNLERLELIFKVSRNTVTAWIKKSSHAAAS